MDHLGSAGSSPAVRSGIIAVIFNTAGIIDFFPGIVDYGTGINRTGIDSVSFTGTRLSPFS